MLKPGERFERYTIEALLGRGGMGVVYSAHDPRLGRRVALKVMSDDGDEGAAEKAPDGRLLREARAAAALDHPNAVSIFDVGEHEGTPYIVMELVHGHTLRTAVGDEGVSLAARVGQLADVARALAGAHRRGLVHRDIKPENVMVRDDGMVKVLDFGIARRSRNGVDPHGVTETPALPTLTVEGVKLGTPVYMAPEQIRGDALDGRADQFSWGVLAYELCAGRLPWRGGDALAVMASSLTDTPDRAPLTRAGVPPAVQEVILRALGKRADDRFASMDDVVRALDAAARGEPAEEAPVDKGRALPEAPAPPATPPSATEAQRFSTGDVRAVLGRAIEQQAEKQGKLGFDDLLAVAAEVGVDADSLREATRALRAGANAPPASKALAAPDPDALAAPARRDAWLRRQRVDFYRHAGIYGIVNAGLLVLGLVLLGAFTPWWVWFLPALAWGVGLAIHGLTALTSTEDEWREHEEGMRWWRERGRQRHEERMAALERRGRRRVEAPSTGAPAPAPPERERVRVVPADTGRHTERERAAEEEAAIAVEEQRPKRPGAVVPREGPRRR